MGLREPFKNYITDFFRLDFPGHLCRTAFAILVMFLTVFDKADHICFSFKKDNIFIVAGQLFGAIGTGALAGKFGRKVMSLIIHKYCMFY